MKKGVLLILLFISALGFSQKNETTFEKEGNLVKATYFYDNGDIKVQGYFKNKQLTGTWTSYDLKGNKNQIANYKGGKKVGKWLIWNNETIKEINYNKNTIVSVNNYKLATRLVIKD